MVVHLKNKFTVNHFFQIISVANMLNIFPHLSKCLFKKKEKDQTCISLYVLDKF